jgi:secreted Zn-dependent insulinase-like peptidase
MVDIMVEWEDLCQPRIAPKSSLLDVPPLNPFIPTQLSLKPLPEDDAYTYPLAAESETNVEDTTRKHFPTIPPAAPESHLPCLVSQASGLKLYHLQDRKFKRPIAELRLRIVSAGCNESPFARACSDLFVTLCKDALIELCYQASTCELGSNISIDDIGFPIRIHGFDDKLLELTKDILSVFFSFRDVEEEDVLPSSIKAGR